MTITAAALTMHHAALAPHPPAAALGAPVTEVYTASFASSSQEGVYAARFAEAVALLEAGGKGFVGASGGWVVEEGGSGGGRWVGCFGWVSVEAHEAVRGGEGYAEIVRLLTRGAGGVESHHTVFVRG